jgi:MYXO-CTERM domain-containing protein
MLNTKLDDIVALGRRSPVLARVFVAGLSMICALLVGEHAAHGGLGLVIFDQTTGPDSGQGVSSQDFEPAFDASDDAAADDFTVPPGTSWSISTVVANGRYNVTPAAAPTQLLVSAPSVAHVTIYPDGGGQPGSSPICAYTDVPTNDVSGTFTLTLPSACPLPAGTYWLSVRAHMPLDAGSWLWATQTDALSGAPAVWENPGNQSATGCTTWSDMLACQPTAIGPNLRFKLIGTTSTVSATTTTVTSSPNPTVSGQATVITAHVPGLAGLLPTGSVAFTEGTAAVPLGTGTLDAKGDASLSLTALTVGAHTIRATYGGDLNFAGSWGEATHTVNPADSKLVLSVSPNPSSPGGSVALTAVVTASPPGAGAPLGTVTFFDGASPLGASPIGPAGQASLVTDALTLGSHALSASYGGNASFHSSTSSPLTEVVSLGATVVLVTSSSNPSTFGGEVTFTATVSGDLGAPTGMVTFNDGSSVLGSAPLGSGTAALTTSALSGGAHPISAAYGGDGQYSAGSASLVQNVSEAPSATVLTVSSSSSNVGQLVTFTATVTSGVAGDISGSVMFKDGPLTLGTATITAGTATLASAALGEGTHAIIAVYGGSANYAASTSKPVTSVVVAPVDAGVTDSGSPDSGVEADTTDAGTPDAGAVIGSSTAANGNATPAAPSAPEPPATTAPAGTDGPSDVATSGCGCVVAGGGAAPWTIHAAGYALLLGVLGLRRRRRPAERAIVRP